MSQFNDTTADPKKQFLNMLVREHFSLNYNVNTSQTGERAPILIQIQGLTIMIKALLPETDQKTLTTLYNQIEQSLTPGAPIIQRQTIQKMFQTITDIITRNFYADLQFGLIPANVTTTQTEKPKQQYANPNNTAKI